MKITVSKRVLIIVLCAVLVAVGTGLGLYFGLRPKDDGGNGHTHSYGEWQVAKEATCTEDGKRQRVCRAYSIRAFRNRNPRFSPYGRR